MGKRREGREAAVQFLFAHELHRQHSPAEQEAFWQIHSAKPSVRAYAQELVRGVLAHLEPIDAAIRPVVENFRFERLAGVDRNILRLAVHELMNLPEVPAPVILNEAIEVAKNLGGAESGAFVNGVLHKLAQRIRPETKRQAPPPPSQP
ncbi:MAG: transcription antitermination factor NusB, partial [Prosthecobacter sp.]|nr:transcription antitermination factor NusB [Prosthecobacter sp.]